MAGGAYSVDCSFARFMTHMASACAGVKPPYSSANTDSSSPSYGSSSKQSPSGVYTCAGSNGVSDRLPILTTHRRPLRSESQNTAQEGEYGVTNKRWLGIPNVDVLWVLQTRV